MRRIAPFFVACCLPLAAGCDPYIAHLIEGQIANLQRIQPIEEALTDPILSEAERATLNYTPDIRQYAIDVIGLTPGDAYTVFDPNGSTPAAYVLAASARDRLEPYIWFFPIFGFTPAKGFFDVEMGRAEALALQEAGWDVLYARADGFSTLGLFPDPVRQSNLSMDLADFAELLMHEMTHSTVFKFDDADFAESMATFVGRKAAESWFIARFGEDADVTRRARLRWADKEIFDAYVVELYTRASAFYDDARDQGKSHDQILVERETLFAELSQLFESDYQPQLNLPDEWVFAANPTVDNAMILAGVRYQSGLDLYDAVFEAVGRDFPQLLSVLQAAANETNSREYLQNWLAERT
ncbi:MAG: aminopeptidase [Phycisphaerales bacterium]|nr:aminopeptidase [Phycisphaerales bacterium]